ncbi:dienelactone hydrolase family protein [Pseudonocardia hydrocarbonoxydans]|uniref:Carboxymethylenebutenolidase n=1 Tax=Pseudonocardia hydrocarbonoxydans TaxID=76726 RepID=A0A4Y3WPF6_9PSEU|nr:dienelactone hydrolase family protein [Pseudonocardia hydrocarbonoxydans]GEC20161.1 carboxymethylenebutenolidase [Pseudonocardia hydrocarbonoxydans]
MPATTIPGATTVRSLDAHIAVPDGAGPWPGVVVLHEAFGLNADTRAQADRLAAAGYLAVAPNLFSAGGVRCLRSTFSAMLAGRGPVFGDIEATRTWLAARPDCTGRLPRDAREILAGACPVVAGYGGSDLSLRGAAATLEDLLTELGVVHDVTEYPGAGHSFLSTVEGPLASVMKVVGIGPHQPSADDAWRRILAWFGTYLAPPAR